MSTQHTPGPWRATHDGYISSDNGYVPFVSPFREDAHRDKHRNPTPEAMANARLIGVAPSLLKLLEQAEAIISQADKPKVGSFWLPNFLAGARYAIAEAKGELRK